MRLRRSTNDTTPGMFMISTSNRFAVLGKKNVKKTYLAAAICGLVKEKERKAAIYGSHARLHDRARGGGAAAARGGCRPLAAHTERAHSR